MILPEGSTFRKDYLKVLDLLYGKYKQLVEDPDQGVIGGEISIDRNDLKHYNLSAADCFNILRMMSKSRTIIFDYEINEDLLDKLNTNDELFNVGIIKDFETKYLASLAQLNSSAGGQGAVDEKLIYWIVKDKKTGDYLFDGTKIHITNKEADYARIFDAVFSLIPQGGEVSYPDVISQCKSSRLTVNKSAIQRALTGEKANFFLYVPDVNQAPTHGVRLFEATRNGKKLIFNNKR